MFLFSISLLFIWNFQSQLVLIFYILQQIQGFMMFIVISTCSFCSVLKCFCSLHRKSWPTYLVPVLQLISINHFRCIYVQHFCLCFPFMLCSLQRLINWDWVHECFVHAFSCFSFIALPGSLIPICSFTLVDSFEIHFSKAI